MGLDRNCKKLDARRQDTDIVMTKAKSTSGARSKLSMDDEQAYDADLRLLLHYFQNIPSASARLRVISTARKASLSEPLPYNHFVKRS